MSYVSTLLSFPRRLPWGTFGTLQTTDPSTRTGTRPPRSPPQRVRSKIPSSLRILSSPKIGEPPCSDSQNSPSTALENHETFLVGQSVQPLPPDLPVIPASFSSLPLPVSLPPSSSVVPRGNRRRRGEGKREREGREGGRKRRGRGKKGERNFLSQVSQIQSWDNLQTPSEGIFSTATNTDPSSVGVPILTPARRGVEGR